MTNDEKPGTTVQIKLADCRKCKHYRATAVFELCTHAEAVYKVAERIDMHTIGHMRRMYLCGPDAKLFESRDLTSSISVGN